MSVAPEAAERRALTRELVDTGVLICPGCRGNLAFEDGWVRCGACDAVYPARVGVPCLLSPPPTPYRRGDVPAGLVEAVVDKLSLPRVPEVAEAVRQAVADTRLQVSEDFLTAEIAELTDRLGITPGTAEIPARPAAATRTTPILERVTDYLEERMPPATTLLRSVRVANAGGDEVAGVAIAARWEDEEGRPTGDPDPMSPVLPRLRPGQATTVILRMTTPARQGRYRLLLQPVAPIDARPSPVLLSRPIEITSDPGIPLSLPRSDRALDYDADHREATAMLTRLVADRLGARRGRFLEIGGGIHPQTATLAAAGHDVVNVDVSYPLIQLGALWFAHPGAEWIRSGRLAFLTCDGNRLPFADGSFDAVLMFATLHHIALPDRFLAGLRRVLKPDGFVGVFCEPNEPNPEDPAYRRDLEKGVNEQQFSIPEYAAIFARAGVEVIGGRNDRGSLKAILRFPR